VAYVVIALFFGLAGGLVGRLKGSSFLLWFLISAVVPVFGLAAALLYRYDSDEPERPCPRCGKVVKLHDAICTRCGQELEFPEPAPAVKQFAHPGA
jgi:ribosomal protein S27AE